MRRLITFLILLTWLCFMYCVLGQDKKGGVDERPKFEGKAGIEETSDAVNDKTGDGGLFYDKRLSATGTHSCATCHIEAKGWSSGGIPDGVDGKPLAIKGPSLVDAAGHRLYFHDGRATSLEAQIREVLVNPREMGNATVGEAAGRVGLNAEALVKELAKFVRSIKHKPTSFDRFLKGEKHAMSASAMRGWELFRADAMCYLCHDPKNGFKDDKFHHTGAGLFMVKETGKLDLVGSGEIGFGRWNVTKATKDWGAFKTPGLRGCKDTAPYMHDASLKDLEAVIDYYDRGGIGIGPGGRDSGLDPLMRRLNLTRRQKDDLLAFLKEL